MNDYNDNRIDKHINTPFINRIFYSIQNDHYEVYALYGVLIITLIVMLCLLVDTTDDYYETNRFLRNINKRD